jgi:hypothetical protein
MKLPLLRKQRDDIVQDMARHPTFASSGGCQVEFAFDLANASRSLAR